MDSQPKPNDADSVVSSFANERRRYVITVLATIESDVVPLDELATAIAEKCTGDHDQRDVAIRLHHVDLPKLAETDLFEYDPRSSTVRYHPEATSIFPDPLG